MLSIQQKVKCERCGKEYKTFFTEGTHFAERHMIHSLCKRCTTKLVKEFKGFIKRK